MDGVVVERKRVSIQTPGLNPFSSIDRPFLKRMQVFGAFPVRPEDMKCSFRWKNCVKEVKKKSDANRVQAPSNRLFRRQIMKPSQEARLPFRKSICLRSAPTKISVAPTELCKSSILVSCLDALHVLITSCESLFFEEGPHPRYRVRKDRVGGD